MAFQVHKTAFEEESIRVEWGPTENSTPPGTPTVDVKINENLYGNLNCSHQVVECIKKKVENNSQHTDTILPLGNESICFGKKGEENKVCNGSVYKHLESSEVDDRGDKNNYVHLIETNGICVEMKLPSVTVERNQNCTFDTNMDKDSEIVTRGSMDVQTSESVKVSEPDEANHVLQLGDTQNTFVGTKLASVLINDQDISKNLNLNTLKQSIDFQTPAYNKIDDQIDKNASIHLNEFSCALTSTKSPAEVINTNNNIDSICDINSEIIPNNPINFQAHGSVNLDNLGEEIHAVHDEETNSTFTTTELPSVFVRKNQDCSVNSNLNTISETLPNHSIVLFVNHKADHLELNKTVDSHFENFINANGDEELSPGSISNSAITYSDVDCQKISEGLGERDSHTSSENTSQNSIDSDETTETASFNNNLNVDEEMSEHNCLLHPAYVQVLTEINGKDEQISELDNTVRRLKEVLSEETAKSERISELEQLLSQHEKELSLIKREQEVDKQGFALVKKELENKCAILKKDIEIANRDKESMVMRYAVSEKELIDVKKEKETLAKKLKDTIKENESLLDRMKNVVNDKSKLSQLLDTKTSDLSTAHKEIDKLKEEINARDIKIKWTQNKLKTEMETHKEYPSQIDRLMIRVRCLEEDLSNAKMESQNLKKQLEESEQNKVLENQLKEEQAKLIMERYEHSEIETKYKSLQTKYQSIIEENNSLSFKVQKLETERLELEQKLSSSREDTERLSNTVSELQSKIVELDSLNSQLKQSEDKIDTLMSEIERVRHQNEELLHDMSACRARESEMLSFTQKLTTKNVQLQSEFSTLESKAAALEKNEEKSRIELKELKEKLNNVQTELIKEKSKREEETHLLARQIAEKTKRSEAFEVDLADTKANLTQSKLKHTTIVKELQRELSLLRRKLESLESSGHVSSASSVSESPYAQACDVSKEILVQRILKLQSEAAKSAEKIEFLEDHAAQLLAEVQKQSRLLQSYMLREEAGALAPSFSDSHKSALIGWSKFKSPAEVSKHGGIMASLYSSTQQDEGMSLELSLEINRKLQAVLEDTLLKNIMLKENLDTLGDEIVRLKEKK